MELPHEIVDNILQHLTYSDIVNYCNTNRKAMEESDAFLKRRAKIEHIPIELLPASNVASRYLQLYDDRNCLAKVRYIRYKNQEDIKYCFKRAIVNDDLEEVKWLIGLIKVDDYLDSQKAEILTILSIYALENDKNIISKWLLSNLNEYNLERDQQYKDTIINLRNNMRVALNKNQTDVVYYILEHFSKISLRLQLFALTKFAIANDLTNVNKMMREYNISISQYNSTIVDVIESQKKNNNAENLTTLKLLLQNYPGTHDDLNLIMCDHIYFYPTKCSFPILVEYGFNKYISVLYNMMNIRNPNDLDIDNVKWVLLNYGNLMETSALRKIYNFTYNEKMRDLLFEYISLRQ